MCNSTISDRQIEELRRELQQCHIETLALRDQQCSAKEGVSQAFFVRLSNISVIKLHPPFFWFWEVRFWEFWRSFL